MPPQPLFPITLPAPSKTGCVKLIQSFAADTGVSPSTYFSRRGFAGSSTDSSSPKSPISPLPLSPTSLPADPNRLAEYTQELVTEFLTREKREYMLKTKWARSGREQLSKDLGDIELSLCLVSKQQPGPLAQALVPVFLELRRTFLLPNSPLPTKLIDAFVDLLPAPPDPDDIPFREPSLQTATSSLYVNPRLDDTAAFGILQELVTYEKEILQERGMEDVSSALVQIVEYVEKRVRQFQSSCSSTRLTVSSSPTVRTRRLSIRRSSLLPTMEFRRYRPHLHPPHPLSNSPRCTDE